MRQDTLLSPVNLSEGRDDDFLRRTQDLLSQICLDRSSDPDHNRTVFSLLGSPEEIRKAIAKLAIIAIEVLDIRSHGGVHPRLGILDVVPFVPAEPSSNDFSSAIGCANAVANDLAKLGIPVFLYGLVSAVGIQLPNVRKDAFDKLAPDAGPDQPHPTMGAACVGVRGPLVALNVNLDCDEPTAMAIAARMREPDRIRSLGFWLPGRGTAQVSMNLVDPLKLTVTDAVRRVEQLADQFGVSVLGTEIVGTMPRGAIGGATFEELGLNRPPIVIEDHLGKRPGA
jgi:glutamate formiminotransferase